LRLRLLLTPRDSRTGCRSKPSSSVDAALSREGMVRATPTHQQVPPAGGRTPVEVAAPWPFTAALLDLEACLHAPGPRGPSTGPLTSIFILVRATLLTLAPTFPTRSGPCDPAAKPGFLSWGCPKIAPPSYRSRNPTPGDVLPRVSARPLPRVSAALRRLLRDGNANSHPRAVHVVFRHLDGLFLLDLATVLQAAADLGVHCVSSCRETGFPAVHLLPFEAFPPPTATASRTNPGYRGPASPLRPFPIFAFTACLAFSPFLSRRRSVAVSRPAVR